MLKVKTKIKSSPLHGLGLYADQFIPEGTLIFEEDQYTAKITPQQFYEMGPAEQQFVKHYCYKRDGIWHCSMDDDRFTNHSEDPNCRETETATYAARDIQEGEEITTNYSIIGTIMNPSK